MTYLDNAATTLRNPRATARAVAAAIRRGANAGRGNSAAGDYAGATLLACREAAGRLFSAPSDAVSFTLNATHALNIAISTLAKPGTRTAISGYEHNAVYRPLMARESIGVDAKIITSPLFEPEVYLHKLERALSDGATLVVCTHVSNVFGYILPVERADALCAKHGAELIIDASQSAGVLPLDVSQLIATRFVCMPGHKGLYGPQGTGILISLGDVEPLLYGGTGSDSESPDMPDYLPERAEAGTQNLPGIAGLLEGITFVERTGVDAILAHERGFIERVLKRLQIYPKVKPHAAPRLQHQTGVLSVELAGIDCEIAGERLARLGFAVRAGLHCAPLAHKTAGTLGGTVRVSPSVFNRFAEAEAIADALGAVSRSSL